MNAQDPTHAVQGFEIKKKKKRYKYFLKYRM